MNIFVQNTLNKYFFLSIFLFILYQTNAQEKSFKRGVSYGFHSEVDMQKFSEAISWWYNWSPEPDEAIRTTYQNYNVDFAPMAWNAIAIPGVNNWVNQDSNVKFILGFNEPNFIDQANMTPSEAAAAWPAFQQIAIDNNLKTVGPAVNYCGNCVSEGSTTYTNPFKYLDDFFAACTDCEVDYIALHWYGSGNSIVSYVNEARKYGKPIWVTEFASGDTSNPVADIQAQKNYLAGTVNFLERDPDVFRYSWFIGRTNSGINTYPFIDLYGAPGEWTELGEIYKQIPVYDPEMRFEIPGKIQAEEYFLMQGLFAELTEDVSGFLNIGWTDSGDWASYKINVLKSGVYKINVRVAGTQTGSINFLVDDNLKTTIATPNTGGWQKWVTISKEIELEAGEHLLKMDVERGGFNINWISILEKGTIPDDNFEIESVGETCPEKNNGKIIIHAVENYEYVANLKGENVNESYNFNSEKIISNLEPGIYNLCITINSENFEQCYTINIEQGNVISGKATLKNSKAIFEITKGTGPFQVYKNNKILFETKTPIFTVNNINQGDLIEVKSAVACEGIFTKTIDLYKEVSIYPNPTNNILNILLPINKNDVFIQLFTMQGQLIESGYFKVENGNVVISLESKPIGMYVVKIGEINPVSLKVMKYK